MYDFCNTFIFAAQFRKDIYFCKITDLRITETNKRETDIARIINRYQGEGVATLAEFRGKTLSTVYQIRQTPLIIYVCGDTARFQPGEARDYWIEDCSAVSENILLAAHAMGLGAVWAIKYTSCAEIPYHNTLHGIMVRDYYSTTLSANQNENELF